MNVTVLINLNHGQIIARTHDGKEVVVAEKEGAENFCFGYADDREFWIDRYIRGEDSLPIFEGDKVVIEKNAYGVFNVKSVTLPKGDPRNIPKGS